MYKTDLKDETFSINNSARYKLLLQFLPLSFSYAIFDIQLNKFVLLKEKLLIDNDKLFIDDIKQIFKEDEILQNNFTEIKIILGSSKSVLVPKPLFDKNKIIELLSFNSTIDKNETVLFDELKNDMFNIFSFDKNIFNFLKNYFDKIKYHNQGTVLLSNNIHKKTSTKKKIIIDANKSFFEIIYFNNNNLIFRNTFKYTNETDFAFYVISVLEKFEIDNEKDELNISGTITTTSKETEILRKYIKRIRFIRSELNTSYVFNEIEQNRYTNLLNLNNCE
jgi:hypothetical protein